MPVHVPASDRPSRVSVRQHDAELELVVAELALRLLHARIQAGDIVRMNAAEELLHRERAVEMEPEHLSELLVRLDLVAVKVPGPGADATALESRLQPAFRLRHA